MTGEPRTDAAVVIGTAGHIDHGKSSLVLALTGTDPDRLKEEKARGITIELGFAHTREGDVTLSFVDVPGHERFVRNMLAGVGGMDLVMLIVAADESVMPQTREHFDICRLLQVPAGVVVLTKSDLVDEETLELVRLEVRDLVAGSFLDAAPVLPVSARTGDGLPELRRTLVSLSRAGRRRPAAGPVRLPIDRAFSMRGFGTIVTGTLVSGVLKADEEVRILPSGRSAKVRGIQVHGAPHTYVAAGHRAAVNLAGVDVADVARGETLTRNAACSVTRRVDAELDLLPGAKPLRHGARVRFHQGTAEIMGRVALSGGPELQPGGRGFARIRFEAPAVLTRGDRFVLRAYSPTVTIGGGRILDPTPPRTGIRTAAGRSRFARLAPEDDGAALVTLVEEAGLIGVPVADLQPRLAIAAEDAGALIARLSAARMVALTGDVLVAPASLDAASVRILTLLAEYHRAHPLDEGMPREELRERVFARAPGAVFEYVVAQLAEAKRIVARDRVALTTHQLALSDEEVRARDGVLAVLRASGLRPPDPASLAESLGVPPKTIERVVGLLVRQKALVRIQDLVFHEAALTGLKAEVRAMKGSGAPATIDVATFKDRYGVTRKYAIPLLEFLDRERVTRRVGDARHVI